MEMTREQHLAWCKERAIRELDAGDVNGALASMASDLNKHPETERHAAIQLGMMSCNSTWDDEADGWPSVVAAGHAPVYRRLQLRLFPPEKRSRGHENGSCRNHQRGVHYPL